jgi:hypothetical protein
MSDYKAFFPTDMNPDVLEKYFRFDSLRFVSAASGL